MSARRPEIAAAVSAAIKASPLDQVQLAKRLDVSPATISRWASGASSPAPDHWPKIAEVLHLYLAPRPRPVDDDEPAERRLWGAIRELEDEVSQLRAQLRALAAESRRLGRELDADDELPDDAIPGDRAEGEGP